ncbi:sucrase ferredoxin [Microlunatus speluncae]|uniref:sucrase ferredoxin n=1 Tax=Microlunatus speluncae TaxID=2594267 RepID=UPI00126654D3|nr:sucrase ferredoxin [Microlunatus speluncae]
MINQENVSAAVPETDCSPRSQARGESLAGTASGIRAFLLIEHDGPWGTEALEDSRLPGAVLARLRREAGRTGVRALLIRRFRRRRGHATARPRIFVAHTRPDRAWCETTTLDGYGALADLDLDALSRGERLGLQDHPEPVLAVCTHGRHDTCCASYGRPVAAALAAALPDHTWECSHVGGDRYAANLVTLPGGFYFGRLTPVAAVSVAHRLLAGELELDHLRGRSWFATPVQAAEIAVRRASDEHRIEAVRLLRREITDQADGRLTRCRFAVTGAGDWIAEVLTTAGEPELLTCRAIKRNRPAVHTILAVRPAAT